MSMNHTAIPETPVRAENEAKHRTEEWQSLLTEQARRSDQPHSFSTGNGPVPAARGLTVRS